MFANSMNEISLFETRRSSARKPSYRPAVEALEERVVLDSTGDIVPTSLDSTATTTSTPSPQAAVMFQLLQGQTALLQQVGRVAYGQRQPTRRFAIQGQRILNGFTGVGRMLLETGDLKNDPQLRALGNALLKVDDELRNALQKIDTLALNRQIRSGASAVARVAVRNQIQSLVNQAQTALREATAPLQQTFGPLLGQ